MAEKKNGAGSKSSGRSASAAKKTTATKSSAAKTATAKTTTAKKTAATKTASKTAAAKTTKTTTAKATTAKATTAKATTAKATTAKAAATKSASKTAQPRASKPLAADMETGVVLRETPAPAMENRNLTNGNEIFTRNLGGFGMQDYSFGNSNNLNSKKEEDDKKKKRTIIIAIIVAAILLLIGIAGAAIALGGRSGSSKDPAAQRANTLALVQKYLEKGQYDDAMKLLNELLQADINDKEADELLDKAIELKKLAEAQGGGLGSGFDADELTNALREQNERNQETINRLLAQQQRGGGSSSGMDDYAALRQAEEEQRKKEDAERKAKEEELAKKNKALRDKINSINEKVLAGKADLNTGNVDSALSNFAAATKQLPLSEGEPEFSAEKFSEIAKALYDASQNENDPTQKAKLNNAAVQYVNQALAKDPNNAVAHYIMGMNYIDSNEWEKAQKELASAVKSDPNNYLYYYNLGRAQYRLKNYTAARSSFESSIKCKKDFASAYYNLGMTCKSLKLNKDALSAFRSAHQYDPQHTKAYLEEARILNSDFNDAKGALSAYKKVIELDPVNTQALNECGTVYAGMGDYAQAENCYRRAVALLKPGTKDPITYYNLATALYNQNKFSDAEKNAQTAYSQMDALNRNSDKAMIVYNYALIEDMLGNSDKAITLYKEVLVLDPSNAKTKTNLGKMFMNMNPPDADTALTFYLDAYKVSPSFELENNMGSAYLVKKDYNNAITYFQKAIKRSPKDNTVRFNLAQAYSGAGDFENAKTTYLEILNSDTNNWDSYIEVAKVYMALKDTANAEAYLKILQQKNPTYKKDQVDALLAATAM